MTFNCYVPGCGEGGNRNLHSFPKDQLQCRNWIAATKCFNLAKETAWKSHRKVCRKHFKQTDLKNGNLLKKGVVPSLLLPHAITIEHSYCKKNSVRVNENVSSITEKDGQEKERVLEVGIMEINETDDVQGQGCVPEYEMIETVEDVNKVDGAQEQRSVLQNDLGQVVKNSSKSDGNVLQNSTMEVVDDTISGGSINDREKPLMNNTQNCNVKSVDQGQNNSTKSRSYDPAARKMRYLVSRNKYLTKKLKESQLKSPKSNKKTKNKKKIEQVLKTLSSTLPPEQYSFIKLQISNAGKQKQGNRFTFDEKTLALAIYKQSPKGYRFLLKSKSANLPCRQTLITHSASIRFMEGINPKLMNFIKEAVSEMEELDKICTIGWDEMSLTAHLDFEQIKDYIDGFEDFGEKRTNNFATHALVFMIRGVKSAYKQPLAYFLTQNIDSSELAELIRLVIGAVSDAGLKVVGSVCDAVATNIAAVNKLIDPNCIRMNTTGNLLEYQIKDFKIIHYWDPPHLIKSVRNNLLVKDLMHCVSFNQTKYKPTGKVVWNDKNKQQQWASWSDIRDFFKFNTDGNGLFNLIPNITDEHLNPERRKMKVKLATQVFSETFGRNMYFCSKRKQLKNNDCIGTAALLLFFNDVFDSVNGDGTPEQDTLKGSVTPNSKHFQFWDYSIRMLESMKFSENLETGYENRSNVLKHFATTLKGMREISQRLFKLGFKSVPLRRGNQDGLENHFSIIRTLCGSNQKPNSRDFKCAWSTSILTNLLTDHSINANCEADKDKPMLQNLKLLFVHKTDSGSEHDPNATYEDGSENTMLQNFEQEPLQDNEDNTSESMRRNLPSEKPDFPENEAQNCVSGLICKKLIEKIKCTACSAAVQIEGKCLEHEIMRKQSPKNGVIILPNVQLIDSIKGLIFKVTKMLPVLCAEKNLMQKLLSGVEFENKLGCERHQHEFTDQLKKITLSVSIRTYTRRINNILSGKITEASEDAIEKKALEFKIKKKHIGKYVPPSK